MTIKGIKMSQTGIEILDIYGKCVERHQREKNKMKERFKRTLMIIENTYREKLKLPLKVIEDYNGYV